MLNWATDKLSILEARVFGVDYHTKANQKSTHWQKNKKNITQKIKFNSIICTWHQVDALCRIHYQYRQVVSLSPFLEIFQLIGPGPPKEIFGDPWSTALQPIALNGSNDTDHWISHNGLILSWSTDSYRDGCHTILCQLSEKLTSYKKLSYRRKTARCVVSVEILPTATQQCRNYMYDKSWTNRADV